MSVMDEVWEFAKDEMVLCYKDEWQRKDFSVAKELIYALMASEDPFIMEFQEVAVAEVVTHSKRALELANPS
jgi:hypothetical protein